MFVVGSSSIIGAYIRQFLAKCKLVKYREFQHSVNNIIKVCNYYCALSLYDVIISVIFCICMGLQCQFICI